MIHCPFCNCQTVTCLKLTSPKQAHRQPQAPYQGLPGTNMIHVNLATASARYRFQHPQNGEKRVSESKDPISQCPRKGHLSQNIPIFLAKPCREVGIVGLINHLPCPVRTGTSGECPTLPMTGRPLLSKPRPGSFRDRIPEGASHDARVLPCFHVVLSRYR